MSESKALVLAGNQVAKGSVTDIAVGSDTRLANVLYNIDGLVLLDVSGSMVALDAQLNGRLVTRHEKAYNELVRLQEDNPGKIALLCYSDYVQFCPNGFPVEQNGGTAMLAALEYVKEFAGTGIQVTLISDGWPTDCDEEDLIRFARNFHSPIHTIYAGAVDDAKAIALMRAIANASGGLTEAEGIADIYNPVEKILLASSTQE